MTFEYGCEGGKGTKLVNAKGGCPRQEIQQAQAPWTDGGQCGWRRVSKGRVRGDEVRAEGAGWGDSDYAGLCSYPEDFGFSKWDEKSFKVLNKRMTWFDFCFNGISLAAVLRKYYSRARVKTRDLLTRAFQHSGEKVVSGRDQRAVWKWWGVVRFWIFLKGRVDRICWLVRHEGRWEEEGKMGGVIYQDGEDRRGGDLAGRSGVWFWTS